MSEPVRVQNSGPTYIWRGMVRHVRKFKRGYIPRPDPPPQTVFAAGIRWLLPWGKDDYPGRGKGAQEALGHRTTVRAMWNYQSGVRPTPQWLAEALAAEIEARSRKGLEIAEALRSEATKPRRRAPAGFAVPGADGLDGRSKSGRRPAKGDREL